MTVDELLLEARAMLHRVSPEDAFREMQRGALLVDIRYLEQRVRDGDIPNAALVNRNEFEWRCDPSADYRHPMIKPNDFEQRIIVLCNQGYQSSFAAANLVRLGLRNATDVEGGMEAWLQCGLPTVQLKKPALRDLLIARQGARRHGRSHVRPTLSKNSQNVEGAMAYTYRCKDYPGMEACPGSFTAESADEVMRHVELHAKAAHGEDPKRWSADDRKQLQTLITAS